MDQQYDPQNGTASEHPGRKPTTEEAEAILTLVRGGWLKLELIDHDRR